MQYREENLFNFKINR